jgi:hypothetical protein
MRWSARPAAQRIMSRSGRCRGRAAATVFGLLAVAGEVAAAPLSKDECEAVKSEQSGLVGKGVRADMEKGVDWAKANLDQARMQLVARLIEVDEQVLFRCATRPSGIVGEGQERPPPTEAKAAAEPAAAAQPAAPGAKDAGAAGAGAAAGQGELKPQAATAETPPNKRKREPKASAPKPKAEAKSKVKAKPKAEGKPKAEDAYVPPQGAPQSVLLPPEGAAPDGGKAE